MKHLVFLLALAIATTAHAQYDPAAVKAWKARPVETLKEYPLFTPLSETRALAGATYHNQVLLDENLKPIELPRHSNVHHDNKHLDLLLIYYNRKTGVVDFNGRLIVPIECDQVWLLKEGIKLRKGNQLEWRTLDGQLLWQKTLPEQVRPGHNWYGMFIDVYDSRNRCGVMDTSGQWRIAPDFKNIIVYRTLNNEITINWIGIIGRNTRRLLLPERSWQSKNIYQEFGPSNEAGFWAKKEQHGSFLFYNYNEIPQSAAGAFNKMGKARDEYITEQSGRQGLMNRQGQVLLPTEFSQIYSMNNLSVGDDVLMVARDNRHGIWQDGQWLIPMQFERLHEYTNGFYATRNDSVFFFNRAGALQAAIYMKPPVSVYGDWAWSSSQPNRAFHRETGWVEVPPGTISAIEDNGYLKLSSGAGAVTLLDPKGNVILDKVQKVHSLRWGAFNSPVVFTYEQGYDGYGWKVQEKGISVKPQYESVSTCFGGLLLARKQFKYGIVALNGRELIPFEYDQYLDIGNCGLIFLKKNNVWHCFDLDGQPVLDQTFEEVNCGYFCWGKTAGGWRLLAPDAKGRLASTAFKSVLPERDQMFIMPENGKYGLMGLDGTVLLPFEWDTLVSDNTILWGRKGNTIKILQSSTNQTFEVAGKHIQQHYAGYYQVERDGRQYLYTIAGQPLLSDGFLSIKFITGRSSSYLLCEYKQNNWHLLDEWGKTIHTFEGIAPRINYVLGNAIDYVRNGQSYIWSIDKQKEMDFGYVVVANIKNTDLYIAFITPKQEVMSQNSPVYRYGIIDGDMNIRLPFEYQAITTIANERFIWTRKPNYKCALFNNNVAVCIPEDIYDNSKIKQEGDNLLTVKKNLKVGVYIIDQQKWIPAAMDDISACNVRIPLGKSAFLIRKNGKYGLMDSDCREIVPPVYDSMTNKNNNVLLLEQNKQFFLYHTLEQKMSTDTLDFVDWAGPEHLIGQRGQRWAIYKGADRIFTQPGIKIDSAMGGYFVVLTDQKTSLCGLSHIDGTPVLPIAYEGISMASRELAYVKKGEKTGLVDINGKIVIPFEADQISVEQPIITARNKASQQWGLFDLQGHQLLPYNYELIKMDIHSQHLIAKKNGKYQYLLLNGQPMHQTEWDFADEYSNGRALVGRNGKYGYIDSKGALVIPLQFRFADRFAGYGAYLYAWVIRDKLMELIDPKGEPYTQSIPEYYKLQAYEAPWETSETMKMTPFRPYMTYRGYVFAKINATQKMGIMNVLGEWLLAPEYDQIITSSNGSSLSNQNIALAYIQQNGKWGIVGLDCQVLVQPKYDSIVYDAKKKQFLGMLGGKQVVVEMK